MLGAAASAENGDIEAGWSIEIDILAVGIQRDTGLVVALLEGDGEGVALATPDLAGFGNGDWGVVVNGVAEVVEGVLGVVAIVYGDIQVNVASDRAVVGGGDGEF